MAFEEFSVEKFRRMRLEADSDDLVSSWISIKAIAEKMLNRLDSISEESAEYAMNYIDLMHSDPDNGNFATVKYWSEQAWEPLHKLYLKLDELNKAIEQFKKGS